MYTRGKTNNLQLHNTGDHEIFSHLVLNKKYKFVPKVNLHYVQGAGT